VDHAEDAVSALEPRHCATDFADGAADIETEDERWLTEEGHRTGAEFAVGGVDRGCRQFDQDMSGRGGGTGDLDGLQDIRVSQAPLADSFHGLVLSDPSVVGPS